MGASLASSAITGLFLHPLHLLGFYCLLAFSLELGRRAWWKALVMGCTNGLFQFISEFPRKL